MYIVYSMKCTYTLMIRCVVYMYINDKVRCVHVHVCGGLLIANYFVRIYCFSPRCWRTRVTQLCICCMLTPDSGMCVCVCVCVYL